MAPFIHPERRRTSVVVTAAHAAVLLCGSIRPTPTSSFCPFPHRTPPRRLPRDHIAPPVGAPASTTALFFLESGDEEAVDRDAVRGSSLGWTTWDVALNIGREEGTWMPESWGESGARLLLKTQIQFRPYPLYHRLSELEGDTDDFLGGSNEDARICHVVGGEMTLGPSTTESERTIYANNGGWRIARGQGPMGCDELRFFVELGKRVERGDVFCPAGRLYCACKYFDVGQLRRSRKADAQQTLDSLGKYAKLLNQANDEGPLSLSRMRLWMDMFKCRVDIDRASKELNDLRSTEPDLRLLSLSQGGDIGLTRGFASCKVQKGPFGLGSEYHILGRMELKPFKNGKEK